MNQEEHLLDLNLENCQKTVCLKDFKLSNK